MANNVITLKSLKKRSNQSLYNHLINHKWTKTAIIDALEFSGEKVEKGLSLKQLVEKFHDEICECIFEAYQDAD